MDIRAKFSAIFYKGDTYCDFLFAFPLIHLMNQALTVLNYNVVKTKLLTFLNRNIDSCFSSLQDKGRTDRY